MIFRAVWLALGVLWAISGAAAVWQGRDDAAGTVALCAVVLVVCAFVTGRRSHGAKARAQARAHARAEARAAATAGSESSARVLVVNSVGQQQESLRPAVWQAGGGDRLEAVAIEALRAGELDAGDEVDELVIDEAPAREGVQLRGF